MKLDYSRLIKPSPIVLLAGAGASAAFGMPTMVQFRKRSGVQLESIEKPLWEGLVDAAAKSTHISKAKVNIEHILTYIENREISFKKACSLWKKLNNRKYTEPTIAEIHDLRQTLWRLREKIHEGIVATYQSADIDEVVTCYDPLFSMFNQIAGQRLIHVFTINYDFAFEDLAARIPVKYEITDGFSNSSSASYQSLYVPQSVAGHSLILYKLHGSFNWEYIPKSGGIHKTNRRMNDVENIVMVPPTAHKNFRQGYYSKPFKTGYSRLVNLFCQVGAVKVLLVVGYGFADRELRQGITDALTYEEKAAMIIVDPNLTMPQIAKTFPSINESRIRLISEYFGSTETLRAIRQAITQQLSE